MPIALLELRDRQYPVLPRALEPWRHVPKYVCPRTHNPLPRATIRVLASSPRHLPWNRDRHPGAPRLGRAPIARKSYQPAPISKQNPIGDNATPNGMTCCRACRRATERPLGCCAKGSQSKNPASFGVLPLTYLGTSCDRGGAVTSSKPTCQHAKCPNLQWAFQTQPAIITSTR